MNAQNVLSPAKVPISMTPHLHRIFMASTLAVVVGSLLMVPGAWAETYTSFNTDIPFYFYNYCCDHNDMQYMDAVYFGGREIIFFTLLSTVPNHTYSNWLYFFTNSPSYSGSVYHPS